MYLITQMHFYRSQIPSLFSRWERALHHHHCRRRPPLPFPLRLLQVSQKRAAGGAPHNLQPLLPVVVGTFRAAQILMKMTIPTAVPAPTASISSTVTVDCGSSSSAEMAANHGQTNESGSGSFSSSSSIPSSTAMAHPPPTLPHVPSLLHNNTLHQPADGQQQQQRPRRRWWPATMEDDNRHWQLPMPYRPVTFSSSSRMFLTAVVLLCLLCCPHYIR